MAEVNEAIKIEDEELENVAGGVATSYSYYCQECKCGIRPKEVYWYDGYKHRGCGGKVDEITVYNGTVKSDH